MGCSAAVACSPVLEESPVLSAQQLSWAKSKLFVFDRVPMRIAQSASLWQIAYLLPWCCPWQPSKKPGQRDIHALAVAEGA